MKWFVLTFFAVAAGVCGFAVGQARTEPTSHVPSKTKAALPRINLSSPRATDLESLTAADLIQAAKGRITISDLEREKLRFVEWAERSPEAAMRAMEEYDPYDWRDELVKVVLNTINATNAPLSLDLLLKSEVRGHWRAEIIRKWFHENFDATAPAMIARRAEFRELLSRNDGFLGYPDASIPGAEFYQPCLPELCS